MSDSWGSIKSLLYILYTMDISEEQKGLELNLRGIRLAIQFKTFLLGLDLQSRRHILDYCKRWFYLEQNKSTEDIERNKKLFAWFQDAHNIYMNDDEQSKKKQITSMHIWDDLYINLSISLSFQKLVSFFMNGNLPQDNLC
jgi:hypothetical protein